MCQAERWSSASRSSLEISLWSWWCTFISSGQMRRGVNLYVSNFSRSTNLPPGYVYVLKLMFNQSETENIHFLMRSPCMARYPPQTSPGLRKKQGKCLSSSLFLTNLTCWIVDSPCTKQRVIQTADHVYVRAHVERCVHCHHTGLCWSSLKLQGLTALSSRRSNRDLRDFKVSSADNHHCIYVF